MNLKIGDNIVFTDESKELIHSGKLHILDKSYIDKVFVIEKIDVDSYGERYRIFIKISGDQVFYYNTSLKLFKQDIFNDDDFII